MAGYARHSAVVVGSSLMGTDVWRLMRRRDGICDIVSSVRGAQTGRMIQYGVAARRF